MAKRPDWEGAAAAAPKSNNPAAGKVAELAEEASERLAEMEQLNQSLADASARFNFIKTKELPDALAEMGTTTWSSLDGRINVNMKEYVSGSLPKADKETGSDEARKKAIDWITKNGGADLIKTTITITFDKKAHKQAVELAKELKRRKYVFRMESGIHAQTLLGWVREKLKAGEKLALDILGLQVGNYADISVDGIKGKAKKK